MAKLVDAHKQVGDSGRGNTVAEGRSSESSRAGSNPAPLTKKMKGFGYSSFNEIFFLKPYSIGSHRRRSDK